MAFSRGRRLRAARHQPFGPLDRGRLNILIGVLFSGCFGAVALVYLIAVWAIISGIALVAGGMALVRLSGELLVVVGGVLSILLGIALLVHPAVGVVALSWWLGAYALLFGIMLLSAAFRIRYHPI